MSDSSRTRRGQFRRGGAGIALFGLLLAMTAAFMGPGASAASGSSRVPGTEIPLKEDHKGSTNPGFETGDCPGDGWGWHFVLPGNTHEFVSVTATFQSAGVITQTDTGPPSAKHVYIFTPGPDTLVDATAIITAATRGGDHRPTEFNLSHVCPGESPTTSPGPIPTTTTTLPTPPTTSPAPIPPTTTTLPTPPTIPIPTTTTTLPTPPTIPIPIPTTTTTLPGPIPTTTTSTSVAPSSTVVPTTTTTPEPTTTVTDPATTTTEGERAAVLGVQVTPTRTETLPVTGSDDALWLTYLGVGLVVGGAILMLTAGRLVRD